MIAVSRTPPTERTREVNPIVRSPHFIVCHFWQGGQVRQVLTSEGEFAAFSSQNKTLSIPRQATARVKSTTLFISEILLNCSEQRSNGFPFLFGSDFDFEHTEDVISLKTKKLLF